MVVKITKENSKVYLSGDKETLDVLKALCTYTDYNARPIFGFIHFKAKGEEGFFEATDAIRFVRHKFYIDTPVDTEIEKLIDPYKIRKLKKGNSFEIKLEDTEYKYPDTSKLLNSFTFPNQIKITLPEELFRIFYYLDKDDEKTGCIFTEKGIEIHKLFTCKNIEDRTTEYVDTELIIEIPLDVREKLSIRAKYLYEFFQYYRTAIRWQFPSLTLKIQYKDAQSPIRLVILPPEEVYYIVMPLRYD